jgi:N-acetyltransferase
MRSSARGVIFLNMDRQLPLANERVRLEPLGEADFDRLFAAAADPLIWAQHPNPDRYQEPVFRNFFKGAIESGGAYLILDAASGNVIGSTRFYNHDPSTRSVHIGYTFLVRSHWGGAYNPACKRLMLDHAFQFVDRVYFQIGVDNRRSRIAIERLGASFVQEQVATYYGETPKLNALYAIDRSTWHQARTG